MCRRLCRHNFFLVDTADTLADTPDTKANTPETKADTSFSRHTRHKSRHIYFHHQSSHLLKGKIEMVFLKKVRGSSPMVSSWLVSVLDHVPKTIMYFLVNPRFIAKRARVGTLQGTAIVILKFRQAHVEFARRRVGSSPHVASRSSPSLHVESARVAACPPSTTSDRRRHRRHRSTIVCFAFGLMVVFQQPSKQKENKQSNPTQHNAMQHNAIQSISNHN